MSNKIFLTDNKKEKAMLYYSALTVDSAIKATVFVCFILSGMILIPMALNTEINPTGTLCSQVVFFAVKGAEVFLSLVGSTLELVFGIVIALSAFDVTKMLISKNKQDEDYIVSLYNRDRNAIWQARLQYVGFLFVMLVGKIGSMTQDIAGIEYDLPDTVKIVFYIMATLLIAICRIIMNKRAKKLNEDNSKK